MEITISWNSGQRAYGLALYLNEPELNAGQKETHVYTSNAFQMINFIRMMKLTYPITIKFHFSITPEAREGLVETFKREGLV